MKTIKRVVVASSIAVIACFSGIAHADANYGNTTNSVINSFGALNTTSYGEYFTAPGGFLKDFSFYAIDGISGNAKLVIANWDGSKAVGPALYTSAPITYSGGAQALGSTNIDLGLDAGSAYIAYLTVAGVTEPVSGVGMAGSDNDGGLGGGFRYLNSGGTDPLTVSDAWNSYSVSNMTYSASFVSALPSAVPEPKTTALLGLGLLGFAVSRRKSAK